MELHLGMDEELIESCWPGLKGGQGWVTARWGCATGCPTRKTECMRPSMGSQEPCVHVLKS